MKSFKEVESTRRDYHRDAALNSVHCASLTVPEIEGFEAEISFLNHFLIKRGYAKVACRVTAIDPGGQRIESRLHSIEDPRVYTIPLTGMVDARVETYVVQFFASDNLFIPFPAVMVNHRGPRSLNTVHAYNRVLNDVFEDDAVNAVAVREASIDMAFDSDRDTFAIFTAGQFPCAGQVSLEVTSGDDRYRATVDIDCPRFANRYISLRDAIPDLPDGTAGVLKIQQPKQMLFYGRMLAGQRHADGGLVGNHSYYDSSETTEYWDDDRPSERVYPFLAGLRNAVRVYPIMSPGALEFAISLFDRRGTSLWQGAVGSLKSPSGTFLEASIDDLAAAQNIDPAEISAFALQASAEAGSVPTRINHQLVHGDGGLESSINVSLYNDNVFVPPTKTGFAWGQIPVGGDVRSKLGIVGGRTGGAEREVELVLYDEEGELGRRAWPLQGNGGTTLDPSSDFADLLDKDPGSAPRNIWYVLTSQRPDLTAYVVSRHASGHCTGEHNY